MRLLPTAALMSALLFSSSAFAKDAIEISSTPTEIREVQADLRKAIERKSGSYSHFTDVERKSIFAKQDELNALIEGKNTIEELDPDGKIAVANALEAVNALVNRAEDNRLICERVKPLGSNRPQNKCMTVGERRRLRDNVRREGFSPTK